jgi:hypothetical protein
VFGPDGVGALELGMDRDEAVANGAVAPLAIEPDSGCLAHTALSGAPADQGLVHVSSNLGVAAIEAYPGVSTPEGIAIGSPVAVVDQAYPDWDPSDQVMRGYAPVPGNDAAHYRIAFDDAGAVRELTLQLVDQDCYE